MVAGVEEASNSDARGGATNSPPSKKQRGSTAGLGVVENRAAACVNILAECHSVFRWQGKIESASEVPLLIKTTRSAYPRVEKLIRSQHPYELPEIITVSEVGGLPAYLQWLINEVSSIDVLNKE